MSSPVFTTLYLYPLITTLTVPYDPTQPLKNWIRPLQPGENSNDDYLYNYYEQDGSIHETVISKGAAALANFNPTPSGTSNQTQVPIPCGPVPTGFQVESTPFGLVLVSTTGSATGTVDPNTTRILAGVNKILTTMNLPNV